MDHAIPLVDVEGDLAREDVEETIIEQPLHIFDENVDLEENIDDEESDSDWEENEDDIVEGVERVTIDHLMDRYGSNYEETTVSTKRAKKPKKKRESPYKMGRGIRMTGRSPMKRIASPTKKRGLIKKGEQRPTVSHSIFNLRSTKLLSVNEEVLRSQPSRQFDGAKSKSQQPSSHESVGCFKRKQPSSHESVQQEQVNEDVQKRLDQHNSVLAAGFQTALAALQKANPSLVIRTGIFDFLLTAHSPGDASSAQDRVSREQIPSSSAMHNPSQEKEINEDHHSSDLEEGADHRRNGENLDC
ncbi:hypothetical protein COLO4_29410 [Corchorus olitorius]|uniref:Uncharacterized protein n=1 Tax=Corchorus olitorius TaxID=93759 RepID=A0A1R3HEL0_9ROSI|nr:hypothetical protein COLO4_29410 [Corchorus olitorius]